MVCILLVDGNNKPHPCIQVYGITEAMSHDTVCFVFENEKRTGGGDVTAVCILRQWNMAWVSFKDPLGRYCVLHMLYNIC